ncbi:alpha,alpha-trehalase TreF [Mucilaginibacter sp. UR6-1]|uniref:alpha,alpha-trehalase TreF n=1 Tax=Mucilaginibacter sp. UR6-1 TaxID=1435643 RepID=UPI001E353AB7|nr:alpha,alpha-trehalase TreF [Mucilaginibacter sp. UR6-1]MCC8408490.1 alpha,alpha-trehalase TreF [Mucilaginibacter sp. UR6-1]
MKKLLLLWLSLYAYAAGAQVKTPAQLYPELFKRVQMERVYADGKTFPDAVPLADAAQINKDYEAQKNQPAFDLAAFVKSHFQEPVANTDVFKSDPSKGIKKHIDTLWTVLQRHPDTAKGTSLLALPNPYIVPGGRFREVYYWDSYFTMLGLQQAGKIKVIEDMVDNFAWLIDNYGHIPNGNRSYYLTRSQPPFFAMMVKLLAEAKGKDVYIKYRPQLVKEYAFWMEGANGLKAGEAHRHVVKLADGTVMNRYWDDSDQPREESYREDVLEAEKSRQPKAQFYRNIRAAAESGWDFSSRWFADGKNLHSIQTVNLVPVDLNSLLYNLEQVIARGYREDGNAEQAEVYSAKAQKRSRAITKYCWDAKQGFYVDYNWKTKTRSTQLTIAAAFPLFFNLAADAQARQLSAKIKNRFLQTGGVSTTLKNTGQQWDRPNGWAPLQYITIIGLRNYKQTTLAKTIATGWIKQNTTAFKQTGKLLEKYNIELKGNAAKAGGGEYPLQDGFGWTNGVLLKLLRIYPQTYQGTL